LKKPLRLLAIASYLSPGVEFCGGIGLIDDSDPLADQQHYSF
jgi:hypothetical protein